jgi:hypothetical protein
MDMPTQRDHPRGMAKSVRAAKSRERKMHVTTIRIYRDQWAALQQRALDLKKTRGESGRLDASAVLREVLDRAGVKG